MKNHCSTNGNQQLTNRIVMQKVLPVLFILTAVLLSFVIQATAPIPAVKPNTEQTIKVNTMQIDEQVFTPSYRAYGTVLAKNTLTLTAQVDGQLTYLANNVIEGGRLNIGDQIFKQDQSDLQAILLQRQAEVEIAAAQLTLESGEQRMAEKDYQMMLKDFNESEWQLDLALLLRRPQLSQAKAQLTIAQNALNTAQRALNRSEWISDKNYFVESKQASQGDYLAKGDVIAKLVEVNQLRVPIYLPRELASGVTVGQSVSLYQPDTKRTISAYVSHIFPMLDNKIQLQKVFAEYSLSDSEVAPLIIGDFVEALFEFAPIDNTLRVPLSAIDNDHIWVVSANNTLLKRQVTLLSKDKTSAVILNVVANGEQIITNRMHSPQVNQNVELVGAL